jgi:hypothetical protein
MFIMSCTKDKGKLPIPVVVIPPPPKITLVVVNRFGYKNDSTKHGVNDTVFAGFKLEGNYYFRQQNITNLSYSAFNRNYYDPDNRLSDSITFTTGQHTITVNDKYAYKIGLKWVNTIFPYTTRYLEYATKNYGTGDTIKIAKDTIIKFIWPNDSNSGRFVKTYQYP